MHPTGNSIHRNEAGFVPMHNSESITFALVLHEPHNIACLCSQRTWEKISKVDGISVGIRPGLFRLVAVKVLAFAAPPQVLLVLTGDHEVLACAPTCHETVVTFAPTPLRRRVCMLLYVYCT